MIIGGRLSGGDKAAHKKIAAKVEKAGGGKRAKSETMETRKRSWKRQYVDLHGWLMATTSCRSPNDKTLIGKQNLPKRKKKF